MKMAAIAASVAGSITCHVCKLVRPPGKSAVRPDGPDHATADLGCHRA
jgi:hypothetical protein